jgi:hypothetical protein
MPSRNTPNAKVVEIGSQDVNGSLRTFCPIHFEYTGVASLPAKAST